MAGIAADEAIRIAEAVRGACVAAAIKGYERARMDGLCNEGALEVALDAVRSIDVARLAREVTGKTGGQ